jgi:Holliday junction resolvase
MSSRGHNRERLVRKLLEQSGWVVIRAAGSLGPVDLVALKLGHRPMLIEVKSTSGSIYERFGPSERAALIELAARADAAAVLAYWPLGAQLRLIDSNAWPDTQPKGDQ